jgi:ATP-binding cassette subfamily E protein 1
VGGVQNGTGKTTFVRMLAGTLKSDEQEEAEKAGDMDAAETMGCVGLSPFWGCVCAVFV